MTGPSRDSPRTFRRLPSDDSVAVGEVGSVCVVVWRGAVIDAPFELQRAGLAAVVERHPGRAALVCVVEASATAPGDKLRRASASMIAAHGDRLRCVACVVEGQGFIAAVNRGAVTGMLFLVRNRKTKISVFATVKEAMAWTRTHVELAANFETSVEGLRSTLP